jgi:transposase-like protein
MPTDDLARFCCQNPDCDSYGRRGEGNLLVIDHFGKARHRLLYCRVCKGRFSEFKGTPFFNTKLPHDKVLAVLEHLAEGCGTRQTARLVGVNKNTVVRLAKVTGQHSERLHDELVAFSPSDPGSPVR